MNSIIKDIFKLQSAFSKEVRRTNYKERVIKIKKIKKWIYSNRDRIQNALSEDFTGIRPKIQAPGEPSQDFSIKNETENGYHNFINLIGIESHGLTSSLAIAEYLKEIIA